MNYTKYFGIASEINKQVSSFLLSNFGTKKRMIHKVDSHYGIEEDKVSNQMYEDFLRLKTPEVALYTEEGERNLSGEFVWVVDPIEGTSNYRAGNPFWGTQIALLHKGEPVIAVVNSPYLKQKFWAQKGKGAYLNGDRIKITELENLEKALVDLGRGMKDSDKNWFAETFRRIGKRVRTTRTFGACGLDISYCAAGITDVYLNSGSEIYDLAAGALIVREAGGKVLNFEYKEWRVGDTTFAASNEKLVKEILKINV